MYTFLLLKQVRHQPSPWQTLGCDVKQKKADRELVWSVIHLDV